MAGQPQVDYAQEWIARSGLSDRAIVENRDYREVVSDEPYDKIVSVGMVEHVGRAKLDAYFEVAYRAWRLYMAASVHGFESGRSNVYQSLLSKGDAGAAELPLTRQDLYRD